MNAPDQITDPFLRNIYACFDDKRCENLGKNGKLSIETIESSPGITISFEGCRPACWVKLVLGRKGGANLSIYEGTSSHSTKVILGPKQFFVPDRANLVAGTFESTIEMVCGFNDWEHYPILSRNIMLKWKAIATKWM